MQFGPWGTCECDSRSRARGQNRYEIRLLSGDRFACGRIRADRPTRASRSVLCGGDTIFDDTGNAVQLCQLSAPAESQRRSARVDAEASGQKADFAKIYAASGTSLVPQRQDAVERSNSSLAF